MKKINKMFEDVENFFAEINQAKQREKDENTPSIDTNCVHGDTMYNCKQCFSYNNCMKNYEKQI